MKRIALAFSLFAVLTTCTASNKSQKQVDSYLNNLDRTETLGGIDANNDGIRDDIEAIIEKVDENREAKNMIRYMASAMQKKMITEVNNSQDALKTSGFSRQAIGCVSRQEKLFKDPNLGLDRQLNILIGITYNTEKRLLQYSKIQHYLHGQILSSYSGPCPIISKTTKQNFTF